MKCLFFVPMKALNGLCWEKTFIFQEAKNMAKGKRAIYIGPSDGDSPFKPWFQYGITGYATKIDVPKGDLFHGWHQFLPDGSTSGSSCAGPDMIYFPRG